MVTKLKEKFTKRRNFKSRNVVKTIVDTSEQDKIRVERSAPDVAPASQQYDACNAFVLPSKKRHTKKIHTAGPIKILSKKRRKKLEKIVATKKKKAGRQEIVEALEAMNASTKTMKALTSLQSTQTLGRKRFRSHDFARNMAAANAEIGKAVVEAGRGQANSISSSIKRRLKEQGGQDEAKKLKRIRDPRVVCLSSSSSECSSDSEDENEISEESNKKENSETLKNEVNKDSQINSEVSKSPSDKTVNGTKSPLKDSSNETSATSAQQTTSSSQSGCTSSRHPITSVVTITAEDRKPATFVSVQRDPAMAEARLELPILGEEQPIMEAIRENLITVIVGPTGSGKTTQVPQFLYEAGYASAGQLIGVTEPRRVAAMAMAERVGLELGLTSREVSYQIRFEGNTTAATQIKFMTDGVLLKEFQLDPLLLRYSVIIIDEAHERSVYSDVLIGVLSRVVPARQRKGCKPLRLVIMSATLRVEDFTENARLIKKLGTVPPVVKVEGRMYDVTVHYNRKTDDDYAAAAYNKVCKVHRQLPEGAILVFLTGQQEVNQVCRKLRAAFPRSRLTTTDEENGVESSTDCATTQPTYRMKVNAQRQRRQKGKQRRAEAVEAEAVEPEESLTKKLLQVTLDEFVAAATAFPDNEGEANDVEETPDDDDKLSDEEEERYELGDEEDEEEEKPVEKVTEKIAEENTAEENTSADATAAVAMAGKAKKAATKPVKKNKKGKEYPLYVLPLYSMLPADRQRMVFQPPPKGTRLCVVATNVAETSLTIPDVKYVVDSGRTKEKVFDKVTGVSMFHVTFASQASANQRAGRAGRTAPGHCYRLYSSAIYNDLPKHAKPEILCRPIDDLALILKMMRLPVVNFPYPTPPEHVQIRSALKRLALLGAVAETGLGGTGITEQSNNNTGAIERDTTVITALGRSMSSFPVAPRYAKMLCLSGQHGLWPYTIALVAALTVQEILVEMPLDGAGKDFDLRRAEWRKVRLQWAGTGQRRLLGDIMVLLRAVLEAEANGNTPEFCDQYGLRHKGLQHIRKLRRQLTNEVNLIVPDANVALDPGLLPPSKDQCYALRQLVLSGSVDHVARRVDVSELKDAEEKIRWKYAYRTTELQDPVFLPSSSVLKVEKPEWVVYQDIFETNKMFMRGVTAIEPDWLGRFAPLMCTLSEPLSKPAPYYCPDHDSVMCYRDGSFARADWKLPPSLLPFPPGHDRYCWFAYFLLGGQVIEELKPFAKYLLDTVTLIRPLALRFKQQREDLVRALKVRDVTTKAKLFKLWKIEPKYLLREYSQWFEEKGNATMLIAVWPPLPKTDNEWLA